MENQDSVCYISKIGSVSPIEKADKIEIASVNGWNSVVQKDIHKEGDLVLCLTTDAIIPQILAQKWGVEGYLRKGSRVRTVKLRKTYSECILIPMSDVFTGKDTPKEGDDLMEVLDIHKYEPPLKEVQLPSGKRMLQKDNLNFSKYHKFPNLKNVPHLFKEGDMVKITRKIHGCNGRWGIVKKNKINIIDRIRRFFGNDWVDYEYVYGSHNVIKGSDVNGFYSTDVWRTVAEDNGLEARLWEVARSISKEELGSGVIVYGEVYGPGIQGEKYTYGLEKIDAAMFDATIDGEYLGTAGFDLLADDLDVDVVPVLYEGEWSQEEQDSLVFNQYIEGSKIPHEGVVVTALTGDRQKIAKVINPAYHIYSEKNAVPDSH